MNSKLDDILESLNNKAAFKQRAYRNTLYVFKSLRRKLGFIVDEIRENDKFDKTVPVSLQDVHEFEFHMKLGTDVMVFMMHSSVFSFPGNHKIFHNSYIKEDSKRAYFGQVLIYNFMEDSIKLRRDDDIGYLVKRIFINCDNHFYAEGMNQEQFRYPDISKNELSSEVMRDFVEDSILKAINTDLVTPSYEDSFRITIKQKEMHGAAAKSGSKLGFRMAQEGDSPMN